MSPLTLAVLQSWDLRPGVILVICLAGFLYTRGWLKLRTFHQATDTPKSASRKTQANWRLVSYWTGLTLLLISLVSPIDVLGGYLFTFHMIQHLLMMMFAPPLLWLANPFPALLWGLPATLRLVVARAFLPESPLRRGLAALSQPGWAWMIFVTIYIGWHDPNAYNAALEREWVHDLEHLTFFSVAMLMSWLITSAAPRVQTPLKAGLKIALLLALVPVNMAAGIAITFSQTLIYTYYESAPRLFGLTVMQDQMIGGTLMWIPGSMMYLVGVLVLVARLFKAEEQKHLLTPVRWLPDEKILTPGWGEQG